MLISYIKTRSWFYRTARTALQAAAGVVATNAVAWASGVHDWASLRTVAISAVGVIVPVVLAAVMNCAKEEIEEDLDAAVDSSAQADEAPTSETEVK